MPVLQQLDPTRAESLLRENREVGVALQRYPKGIQSGIMGLGTVDQSNPGEAVAEQVNYEIGRRQKQILADAKQNPRQALSEALKMPLSNPMMRDYSPRALTLYSLARITLTVDPATSRAALSEMRKIVRDLPLQDYMQNFAGVPELFLQLGETDEARKGLKEQVAAAERLYTKDADASDPNQAFKAWWPSANLWWRCIAFAAKLNPSPAEEIIENIPDEEIKAFERIALANSLLGAETAQFSIIERHKNGMRAHIR